MRRWVLRFLLCALAVLPAVADAIGSNLDNTEDKQSILDDAVRTTWLRFAVLWVDEEAGRAVLIQVYLRNRYYEPETGQFTQVDPARAGDNWYAYAGGDPVNRMDPSGLDWIYVDGQWVWDGEWGGVPKTEEEVLAEYPGLKPPKFFPGPTHIGNIWFDIWGASRIDKSYVDHFHPEDMGWDTTGQRAVRRSRTDAFVRQVMGGPLAALRANTNEGLAFGLGALDRVNNKIARLKAQAGARRRAAFGLVGDTLQILAGKVLIGFGIGGSLPSGGLSLTVSAFGSTQVLRGGESAMVHLSEIYTGRPQGPAPSDRLLSDITGDPNAGFKFDLAVSLAGGFAPAGVRASEQIAFRQALRAEERAFEAGLWARAHDEALLSLGSGGRRLPNEVFYRAMSGEELAAIRANGGGIIPRGEAFITQELSYVRQLQERRPTTYPFLTRFEAAPGTRNALIGAGARNDAKVLEEVGLGGLPTIQGAGPGAVFVKGELGAVNFGLRSESVKIFNSRVIDFTVVEVSEFRRLVRSVTGAGSLR